MAGKSDHDDKEKLPPQEGVTQCHRMCSKTWDLNQVNKFTKMVTEDYGYRLFLDDLPSATVWKDQEHYDWLIPLGYTRE